MVAALKNVYRSREEFLMAGFAEKSGETIQATGAHLLVVAARFNAEIVDALRAGALAAIEAAGAHATLIEVPGSLEIPTATVIAPSSWTVVARLSMAMSCSFCAPDSFNANTA